MVFLLVFLVPGLGTAWLNYVLPASSLVCLPALCLVREQFNRLQLDTSPPADL